MAPTPKLQALLATMGRINPSVFGPPACPPGTELLARRLPLQIVDDQVLCACATRCPELCAGVVAVQRLAARAVAACPDAPETALAEDVEAWCSAAGNDSVPWPTELPRPEWARGSLAEPFRTQDMFYSAAATMAGVAQRIVDRETRQRVEQLAERLLQRAEVSRRAA